MNWCDPCAADPLSDAELQELGVFWLKDNRVKRKPFPPRGAIRQVPRAKDVYVTRLHVRYDAESFPEDLKFKQTGDRQNFQGRYILRHAFDGEMNCPAARDYKKEVNARRETEIKTLSNLTGWERAYIRDKIKESGKGEMFDVSAEPKTDWWNNIWPDKE